MLTVTLSILAGMLILGVIVMAQELRKAPEGMEDKIGFHIVSEDGTHQILSPVIISQAVDPVTPVTYARRN